VGIILKRILFMTLAVLGWLAWGASALAQPKPPTLVKLLNGFTAERDAVQALEAVYEFTVSGLEDQSGPAGEHQVVREKVFFRAPDRIRLNLSWADREEVFLAANLRTLVMVGDQATDTPWPQPFLLFRLLLESEPDRLLELFRAHDIDLAKVTLTPEGDTIILGAEPGQAADSQAWFDAGTLHLTRLILAPSQKHPAYDVTLSDYRPYDSGLQWPHRLYVKTGRGPALGRAAILDLSLLTVNPQIDQDPFDLEEIRRTVAPALESDPSLAQNPDLVEVRKMMEWLEKKLQ
jgi:hypothetical protein